MKNSREKKLEKELKRLNNLIEQKNDIVFRLHNEKYELINDKKEFEELKNKLISEHFLNTSLERKRIEEKIKNDESKNLIFLEGIKNGFPIVQEFIKMFSKNKES